jgi:hypothetical protein
LHFFVSQCHLCIHFWLCADGSSYPFSSYTFQSYYLWVPKLRITRLAAMSDARLCANPLSVQPIPTVYRVTGPQSSHPAYGFYYASFNQPSSDGVLSYQYNCFSSRNSFSECGSHSVLHSCRQYGVSSPWTLSRKSISSVRQWALSYGTNNIYTNAISSEIPPGLDSIWIDVTATPASLFAIAGTLSFYCVLYLLTCLLLTSILQYLTW